jgi:protein-tyrosine-phosphatase
MPSVLFVCTANQFRSPLAAMCFSMILRNEKEEPNWVIESAGTWAKDGMHAPPVAIRIANQLGLDSLERHVSHQIDSNLLNQFKLIIVMENNHREAILSEFPAVEGRLFMLSELATGIRYDIPDPAYPGTNPEDVGREIKSLITRGKDRIIELAESLENS